MMIIKTIVIGECVRGATHIRNRIECQDSMKKKRLHDGTVIMAVADGHGSKECPYSKTGSQIAVNTFCQMMTQICKTGGNRLVTYLRREGEVTLARDLEREWKARILRAHKRRMRPLKASEDGSNDYDELYRMYGTTLLGMMIRDRTVYSFQIGDGDILMVDGDRVESLIKQERILGVETFSLSRRDAWKKAEIDIRSIDLKRGNPVYFIMSTDGFANSYKSEEDFRQTVREYTEMIRNHGTQIVQRNLKKWLEETSNKGCGDDVTLVIACCEEENQDNG